MRLNEASIRKIEPPAKGYQIHRDDEIKGLALRVTANNARAFVLGYTLEGAERRMTLGAWPALSTTAARAQAKDLWKRINRGEDPMTEKQERRAAPTVGDIIAAYLEHYAAKKKSGYMDRQYLLRDVLPEWGRLKAADIRRRDVIDLVQRKAKQTPIAGNLLLGYVRGLFNWAVENDYLETSPAYRVKPPAKKTPRDRWLSESEIRTVWGKIDSAGMSPQSRAALRLILITAQRPGEVLGAEWCEMDLDTRSWLIPREKAKAGAQHGVPLTTMALEQLGPLQRGRWVIPGHRSDGSTRMTVGGLSTAVHVNQEHFGIPRWTPHDLRRTAATHMAKAGVERFLIARVLGHSDKTITAVYERHSYDSEKRRALETWARRLREILEGKPSEKIVSIG